MKMSKLSDYKLVDKVTGLRVQVGSLIGATDYRVFSWIPSYNPRGHGHLFGKNLLTGELKHFNARKAGYLIVPIHPYIDARVNCSSEGCEYTCTPDWDKCERCRASMLRHPSRSGRSNTENNGVLGYPSALAQESK
jgi:hypothetical protein